MTSPATPPTPDLPRALAHIGLHATPGSLDDFIARATRARWQVRTLLEEIAAPKCFTVVACPWRRSRPPSI